ncbi:MAG: hypothetical protein O3C57_03615 [Verrucomicrobia bacterium]|nr:hypothetical protein [Verrucomicrobiota bacterium]
MARSGHESVVFRSSFSDTRLGPLWSVRDGIFGDNLEQLIEEAPLFSGLGMGGVECVSPLALGEPLGSVCRFVPGDESVLGAKALAFAEVGGSGLMDAHNRIDAFGEEFGNGTVGTEAAVGKGHVAFVKEPVLLAEEATFVDMLITLCHRGKSSARKGAQRDARVEPESPDGFAAASQKTIDSPGKTTRERIILNGAYLSAIRI